MGADFVYAIVEVTKPESYWQDIIGELNDGEVMAFAHETNDQYDWFDLYDYENIGEPAFCQKVAERISEAVGVSYGYTQNREMGWYQDGIRTFAITGGMSWGDKPTECIDDVWMFDNFCYWNDKTNEVN